MYVLLPLLDNVHILIHARYNCLSDPRTDPYGSLRGLGVSPGEVRH